jgi:hypothetical protein
METLYIWPEMPALSVTVLIIGTMVFFYLARHPIHSAFESLSEGTSGGLQRISEWARQIADSMRERDRKVLLESGIADAEQKLYEDLARVETSYGKHLADFPALQRKLDDQISAIESDYKECGQVTPEAPGWNDAVASIAKVKGTSGDRVIEKMLGEIHKSAVEGEKKALSELRATTAKRHKILSGMAPTWKRIHHLLKDVGDRVSQVMDTTKRIDKHMTQFEKVRKGDQNSIDMLMFRTTLLFIFSLVIIAIAALGAFVNFQLIAYPMSQLIPTGTRVMGMLVSDISALVIIALEVMCGIFLMEALGVTNIIPQVSIMSRGKRRLILYVSLVFLFLFACTEASLGILREVLTEKEVATTSALAGGEAAVAGDSSQLTVIGQATLGFLLPWVLAMVAMPLEVFFSTGMHVVRKAMIGLVALFGLLCRMVAYLIEYLIKIIVHLYDAYIIIPTQIGNMIGGKTGKAKTT